MADHDNSFDLFCNEESEDLCFYDDDDDDDDVNVESFNDQISSCVDVNVEEARINLPGLSDECIGWMLEREREHLPRNDYLHRFRISTGEFNFPLRAEALDWMFKACAHYNFGELSLYTAVNYFDRFLSVYQLPVTSFEMGNKTWAIQLIAVACLSLAVKKEESKVPLTANLQAGGPKYLFEARTIQRMEVMVMSYLKWKAKAYTPFNFIDYYLIKMNDGQFPPVHLINRSVQIILTTLKGIDFLEFRPSEIAASVAMYVSSEETQTTVIDKALSSFMGVDKGRLVKCIELIKDLTSISGSCSSSTTTTTTNVAVSHSPSGVLEAACLSCNSDGTTVGSCPSSSQSSPENKRRKLEKTTFGGDS